MTHCKRCAILEWMRAQGSPVTAEALADQWSISPRTARRYLSHWEKHGAARVVRFSRAMYWEAA